MSKRYEIGDKIKFNQHGDNGEGVIISGLDIDDDYEVRLTTGFYLGHDVGDEVYINYRSIVEPVGEASGYRYEVTAGTFSRTYEDDGKAIAVARALRDFTDGSLHVDEIIEVSLTKTPITPITEKVIF